MAKTKHEVRDGIHGFIIFDNLEKRIIDSAPFQRLRCIHQLAMCYQVYPGATHKRFEHSLGVMEIATRVFDSLFSGAIEKDVEERISDALTTDALAYYRRTVRLAALLHDVGHLPFSHAAEEQLLPTGWNHERLTAEVIRHSEIRDILESANPPIRPDDIVDLVVDVRKRTKYDLTFSLSPLKTLLNEIITGNTFGADRIDYLLRDSWHSGVSYGRFDPDRLISALRVVINPESDEIAIGVDAGGIHAAEALLLARYFMYTQVYFHDVRRIYDIHLKDFLKSWLPGGFFSSNWESLMLIADDNVISAFRASLLNPRDGHHELAMRLAGRKHYRTAYTLVTEDKKKTPDIFESVVSHSLETFDPDNIRCDSYGPKSEVNDFLVVNDDQSIISSLQASGVIANVPPLEFGFIFAAPSIKQQAETEILRFVKSLRAA